MPFDKINLNQEGLAKLHSVSAFYASVESALSIQTDCREKFLAVTNLEQSYHWFVQMLEREQMEKKLKESVQQQKPVQAQAATPTPTQSKPMSPDAVILAEGRIKLDSLKDAIKELTDAVAINGINL